VARTKRRNPSGAVSFALTVAASVASSLLTIVILEMMRKAREVAAPATLKPEIAPGQGSA
jgi:hypothetical protein